MWIWGDQGAITKNGRGGSKWSYLEASERLEVLRVSQGHYGGMGLGQGSRDRKLINALLQEDQKVGSLFIQEGGRGQGMGLGYSQGAHRWWRCKCC